MSSRHSFDDRVALWIEEEARGAAPDRILDNTFSRTGVTRQVRRPIWWSTSTPLRTALITAGAAVIVVAIGARFLLPGLDGTGAPNLPSFTAHFQSPWYGYTVEYPGGWRAMAGAGPWPIGTSLVPAMHDTHLDTILGQVGRGNARLSAASVELPPGTTMDQFRSWASAPTGCREVDPITPAFTVDRSDTLLSLNGCISTAGLGGHIWDVLVLIDGRGYDFTVDGTIDAADAAAWLSSIALIPDSAPMPSP